MSIEIREVISYSHWASYLINGDATSFDFYNTRDDKAGDRDQAECDEWVNSLAEDGWRVSDCDSESFFGRPDHGGLYGDVIKYTLIREI